MHDAMLSETISYQGDGGDWIEGYRARPLDGAARGSVIVIHHIFGADYDAKDITRRFAYYGYNALCPNLYHREAPGAAPEEAFPIVRAAGGVPRERYLGDVAGAAALLRAAPNSNGAVGIIGFCSGGRQSVLAACALDLDAAVDCYGGMVVGQPPQGSASAALYDDLPNLNCPLLGIFGQEDRQPSPAHVEELRGLLTQHGKDFEFHSYEAGHSFLQADRPAYRPEPATEAWQTIRAFFDRTLNPD
ncbi:MAG: dienelactone hydrolase family protein [Frankiaceae bacterium]|jgi:carboxymethylenebutenolidase|nr:dienelactone hydrolase family protein [Frankiaceae bacterium]